MTPNRNYDTKFFSVKSLKAGFTLVRIIYAARNLLKHLALN
jgi:hypothetical protein